MGKKVKAEKGVVFTNLDDGGGVLLHIDNKYYYSLSESGSFIWQLLEEKGEVEEDVLFQELCENFDVAPEVAKKDLEEFLAELSKEGLVKIE